VLIESDLSPESITGRWARCGEIPDSSHRNFEAVMQGVGVVDGDGW